MNLHCFIILKNTAKQVAFGEFFFFFEGFAGCMITSETLLMLTVTGHIVLWVFLDNCLISHQKFRA